MTEPVPVHSDPVEPLPTIWRVDDALWRRIQTLLQQMDPPAPTGRPRADARAVFDALTHPQPTVDDANVSRVSDDTDAPDAAGAEREWFSIPGNFLGFNTPTYRR
jgi:hypothetical protein